MSAYVPAHDLLTMSDVPRFIFLVVGNYLFWKVACDFPNSYLALLVYFPHPDALPSLPPSLPSQCALLLPTYGTMSFFEF